MPDLLGLLGYGPFTGYCGYLGDDAKKQLNNKLLCIGYDKLGVQGYGGFTGYLGYLGYLGHQSYGYASPPWAIGLQWLYWLLWLSW